MSHPIDTRLIMEKLTQSGTPPDQAKAHTQVLVDALREQDTAIMERACSKEDLRVALEPIYRAITDLTIATARLDARADATNALIASLTAQMLARFDAVDAKFDQVYARIDSTNARIDTTNARIDSTNANIESTAGKMKSEWITWLLAFGLLQTALVGGVLLKLLP